MVIIVIIDLGKLNLMKQNGEKTLQSLFLRFNPSLAKHDMPCLSKQCRSRSVGFWEANWSGSSLFVIKNVNFYQKPESSNLIGWKLEVGVAS